MNFAVGAGAGKKMRSEWTPHFFCWSVFVANKGLHGFVFGQAQVVVRLGSGMVAVFRAHPELALVASRKHGAVFL